MKKMLFCMIFIVATSALFAQFKYPGGKCTDVTILQEQLALAPSKDYKALIMGQIDYIQSSNKTFEGLKTAMSQAADIVWEGNAAENAKHFYIVQFCYLSNTYLDEVGAFCIQYPSAYSINIALRAKDQKKAWALQLFKVCVDNFVLNPRAAPKALTALVEYNINGDLSSDECKDILNRMNIRYTNLLITDKEKWASVVAGIRTLLETYK